MQGMCVACCKNDVCKILVDNTNQFVQGCISYRKGRNGHQVFEYFEQSKRTYTKEFYDSEHFELGSKVTKDRQTWFKVIFKSRKKNRGGLYRYGAELTDSPVTAEQSDHGVEK
jgi:hypothetical protein